MKYRIKPTLIRTLCLVAASALWGADRVGFGSPLSQTPSRGPITAPRDAELEKQSYHNLEVAKFYFYKRKPEKNTKEGWARLNKSIEDRLVEILDTNPNFARMGEVYFMLGELYKRTGDLDKATANWTKAVKENTDEKIKADAQKRLDETKSQNQTKEKDKDKEGVTN